MSSEVLCTTKRIKKHNRVINGDLSALESDNEGNYTLGDETQVDWTAVLKTFFKKVSGSLNA